jgi:hypothetical protein
MLRQRSDFTKSGFTCAWMVAFPDMHSTRHEVIKRWASAWQQIEKRDWNDRGFFITITFDVFKVDLSDEKAGTDANSASLLDRNSFDIYEFANTEFAQLASIAGVFYTAKWKARVGSDHAVDEDAASFKFFDKALLFGRNVGPR